MQSARKSTQRERLLIGMTHVAACEGYAAANIARVIAYAGVSRPTFYEYFSDKDDCFLAALADIGERLLEDVRRAVEGQAPEHAIRAAIAALLRFASSQPQPARFLMDEALAGGPRALGARDQGIAEIEQIVEEAYQLLPPAIPIPDISGRALIGAIYRLLSSRLRRGEIDLSGLLEELIGWLCSYEQPLGEHRWRNLQPAAVPLPSPKTPPLLAPMAPPPGGRLSKEEMAENRRLRILFAAAEIAQKKGYRAATIAEITERAGVERRSFDRVFADKQELFAAVLELQWQHIMAVSAGAFFTEASWPERIWEAEVAFIQTVERYPTLAHFGFIEAHAVGPIVAQRTDELLLAFTVFLQEGYRRQSQGNPPSPLALEAIAATNYEIAYTLIRGSANPTMAGLLPHVTFMSLAPFLGPAEANRFIDQKLNVQPRGGS